MWPIQTNLLMYPYGLTWLPAIMLVLWSVMCENAMCQKFEEAKCEEKRRIWWPGNLREDSEKEGEMSAERYVFCSSNPIL